MIGILAGGNIVLQRHLWWIDRFQNFCCLLPVKTDPLKLSSDSTLNGILQWTGRRKYRVAVSVLGQEWIEMNSMTWIRRN